MEWSERSQWRQKIHERYRDLWDLKLVRKKLPITLRYLKDGETVLEIGAFNRDLEVKIKKIYHRVVYKSMDIDPAYPHDYSSFKEIRETFDMVLLFEVIEHLGLEEGRAMVGSIYEILNHRGRVILTIPNINTPGQYWKDPTHMTPYYYEEIGGLLLSKHFEIVEIRRIFRKSLFKFYLIGYILAPVFRFLGLDFAQSILLVAKKTRCRQEGERDLA
jgi:SAM-dependent methyltransferase